MQVVAENVLGTILQFFLLLLLLPPPPPTLNLQAPISVLPVFFFNHSYFYTYSVYLLYIRGIFNCIFQQCFSLFLVNFLHIFLFTLNCH